MQFHRIQRQGHRCSQKQHDRDLDHGEQGNPADCTPKLLVMEQANIVRNPYKLRAANHFLLEKADIDGVQNRDNEDEHEHQGEWPHELPSTPIRLMFVGPCHRDAVWGETPASLATSCSDMELRAIFCAYLLLNQIFTYFT